MYKNTDKLALIYLSLGEKLKAVGSLLAAGEERIAFNDLGTFVADLFQYTKKFGDLDLYELVNSLYDEDDDAYVPEGVN